MKITHTVVCKELKRVTLWKINVSHVVVFFFIFVKM